MKLFKLKDPALQISLNFEEAEKIAVDQGITKCNEITLEAFKKFNQLERKNTKTFYIWGSKGAGKTFWLKAWASENKERGFYFDLKKENPEIPKSLNTFFYCDNLEYTSERTKIKIFEELITQHETGNLFVFSSCLKVEELGGYKFREDFISRIKQGLVYKLIELPDEEKIIALRLYMCNLGWIRNSKTKTYDFLLTYMLTRFPRELGTLKLVIDTLNEYAIQKKRSVSLKMIKEVVNFEKI